MLGSSWSHALVREVTLPGWIPRRPATCSTLGSEEQSSSFGENRGLSPGSTKFQLKLEGREPLERTWGDCQGGECLSFPKRTRHKDGRQQQCV